ncbi:MAG: tetratricopeptide repeat protein [Muribaculaceae bacterium]|nr:tetratricopeptide repeat protein [Muribaculaceae bacterium]
MRYRNILFTALLAAGTFVASADADDYLSRAEQMYSTGNYVGAIDQLSRYLNLAPGQLMSADSDRASAELLMLQARLQHGDLLRALQGADTFIQEYAGSQLIPEAQLVKAEALYYKQDYAAAVKVFEALPFDTFDTANSDRAKFEYAGSLTRLGVYDKARSIFMGLQNSEWGSEATFYVAYIDYVQADLDNALRCFLQVPPQDAYRLGVDFFVNQIYFDQGKYTQVLDNEANLLSAAKRLQGVGSNHESEAYRVLGESAYSLGNMSKAKQYLTKHVELHSAAGVPSARYILGVMAYNDGNYTEADEWLVPVTNQENPLGQSATLYLGQSAARRGDHTSAAIYFDRAAHQTYDTNVAETALYNYAAAVAAGGRVPFGSASSLLEEFGTRYPDSKYKAAVDEYLAIGYLAEKRYAKALAKLDGIRNPSPEVRKLTRQTLYELGASELAAGDAATAEAYLRRAASTGATDEVGTASRLWLAEALYAQKKYAEAVTAYKQFLDIAPSSNTSRAQAYYNMAYALYQQGIYKACRTALDNALKIKGAGALSASLRTDAQLRRADCDNYLGNVREALNAYNDIASETTGTAADYAALQAACMQGVLGNYAAKRQALEQMLAKWPDSPWAQQAYYELADACLNTNDFAGAIRAQESLRTLAPNSSLLRDSKLLLAATYRRDNKETDAINTYKSIISAWPSSSQAVAASAALQNIYSAKGELGSLIDFLATVPGAPMPEASELDQLTYVNAVSAMDKNPNDTSAMEDYMKRFPKGRYVADALLALANTYRDTRNSDKALSVIDTLLSSYADSDAALTALSLKGEILQAKGLHQEAALAYKQLLARGGAEYTPEAYKGLIMNTADPAERLMYIDKYLSLNTIDADERAEADLLKADCLIDLGRSTEAASLLRTIAADMSTAEGGSAAVKLAQLYINAGNPKEAEKLMLALTDAGCDDIDTQALGYITLADAYAAQGNKRLAYQYYESLSTNYPGDSDEILNLIKAGLKKNK